MFFAVLYTVAEKSCW